MGVRRISMTDLEVGKPMPWDVSDANGRLLLKKGQIVSQASQLEALVDRGLYADAPPALSRSQDEAAPQQESPSVLRLVNLANKRLERLLLSFSHEPDFPGKLMEVAKVIAHAVDLNPDVAVAGILLNQQAGDYPVRHSIDTAVIAILIGRAMNLADADLTILTAAALTMNIGMIQYQGQLQHKQSKLSEEEIALIRQHPLEGVKRLEEAGVHDPDWLALVLAHHENDAGNGYPGGKMGADIPRNAKIIALADRYCASVSARDYRKSALPNVALREIFLESGKGLDPALAPHFIKVLGIYPPGSLVRLQNGEIGVVSQRGDSATTPCVHALVGPRGTPLAIPIKRDTAREGFAISEALSQEEANVRFSMQQVWGKEARL